MKAPVIKMRLKYSEEQFIKEWKKIIVQAIEKKEFNRNSK